MKPVVPMGSEADILPPEAGECLRLNYSRDPAEVASGLQIVAEEVARAYA